MGFFRDWAEELTPHSKADITMGGIVAGTIVLLTVLSMAYSLYSKSLKAQFMHDCVSKTRESRLCAAASEDM